MSLADRFPAVRIERWERDGSSVEIRFLKPSVILFTYRGVAMLDELKFVEGLVEQVIAQGLRPVMFIDALELRSYQSDAREEMGRWGRHLKDRAPPIQCLFRSKILEMFLAVTNMVVSTPIMRPYSDEKVFEAAVRRALAEAG